MSIAWYIQSGVSQSADPHDKLTEAPVNTVITCAAKANKEHMMHSLLAFSSLLQNLKGTMFLPSGGQSELELIDQEKSPRKGLTVIAA